MMEHTEETDSTEGLSIDLSRRYPDKLLHELVDLAHLGFGFGVTLMVGGSLISGNVVSGRKYFEALMEQSIGKAVNNPRLVEALKARFQPFLDLYPESPESEIPDRPPSFIHLEGARFYAPMNSKPLMEDGVLWRGHINDVSGLFFGTLGSDS
ncbi:hypothetical protein ACQ5SB_14615 [Stenotrophomonas geniculata]|uniref:hypothetical protein n=1 Tax=Stenotrophomonas TaxID=40323 RepID=UPI003D34B1EE